jgi:hypothetical protein
MIISASYKTDIPTFYGDWFVNRVEAGYCNVVNGYNQRVSRISLRREDVDAFVFWTKNVGPFMTHLKYIHDLMYPFVVQYTINGYPRSLESRVTDADRSIGYIRELTNRFGSRVAVWRYDTILFSSLTDSAFHLRNFERLARELSGTVDEVVVSFAHLYQKTLRNVTAAAHEHGFEWWDPTAEEKRSLLEGLVDRASGYGIKLTVCSQPDYVVHGAAEARCIDAQRIQDVSGRSLRARIKGNRPGCGCYESRDIGEYDTCPHGCIYCYAVRNDVLAKERFRNHDPEAEFLFPPARVMNEAREIQLPIFGVNDQS